MDEKRCISVPRTLSQIGVINTQQVDTDGEYFYSLLRENECFAEMCRKCFISRGGAAYLYLISILMWPHFDTYPYVSIQNILMRAQNILITKIYL